MTAAPSPALTQLLRRSSRPARSLQAPYPDRVALTPILTAALRVPDHGKLEPWRLIVLGRAALDRLAALVPERGQALGIEPEKIAKAEAQYRDSGLAVAVIGCPRGADRIPAIEQELSAGAVCMNLLQAAAAEGWAGNWLTGWQVYDAEFTTRGLGLTGSEWVAGIIHLGTPTQDFPERPRPDLAVRVTWEA